MVPKSALTRFFQRNRTTRRYTDPERERKRGRKGGGGGGGTETDWFTLRNWFMRLWRLGKSKLCRVRCEAGDPGKKCNFSSKTVARRIFASLGKVSLYLLRWSMN